MYYRLYINAVCAPADIFISTVTELIIQFGTLPLVYLSQEIDLGVAALKIFYLVYHFTFLFIYTLAAAYMLE